MTRRVRGPLDGPLLPYGPGFEAALAGQGYSADSIGRHLRLMVHLSRWLAEQHLAAGDLTAGCARRFLRFRQAQGHAHPVSMSGMAPLLDYLGSAGAAPAAEQQAAGLMDALIAQYQHYLLQERGLAPQSSVPHYADVARRFVTHVRAGTPGELQGLTVAAVTGFVLSVNQRRSVGEAKAVSTRLRSFLRYLELEGLTRPGLAAAVPSVAGWALTGLPRAISTADVGRLLGKLRSRAPGRAPGLRDPDRAGAARAARRRGRRAAAGGHRLACRGARRARQGRPGRPAAADAGGCEAIAGWLQDGRPRCASAAVFTRVLAPHRSLSDRAVSAVVRQACVRAGLPPMGSHRLRHTVATQTLRADGTLTEVGHLLRQRSLAATSLYAKVDRGALSAVARPWPGGPA